MVSHSPADVIRRHYESHPWADFIRPDLVLGWDQDRQIANGICLDPREVLDFDGVGPSPSDSRSKNGVGTIHCGDLPVLFFTMVSGLNFTTRL